MGTQTLSSSDVSVLSAALEVLRATGDRRYTEEEYDALAANLGRIGDAALDREKRLKWDDIRPGSMITVKDPGRRRAFRLKVTEIEQDDRMATYRFVRGVRLTLDGRPSRLRVHTGCGPGERNELISINSIQAVEGPPA